MGKWYVVSDHFTDVKTHIGNLAITYKSGRFGRCKSGHLSFHRNLTHGLHMRLYEEILGTAWLSCALYIGGSGEYRIERDGIVAGDAINVRNNNIAWMHRSTNRVWPMTASIR